MRTTKFLTVLLAGLFGVAVTSCNKEEKETPVVENEVTFTVGVGQLGTDSADIIVRHDGKNSAQWYGFLTEDIQADEEGLIQGQLANVSKSTIHVGTSQTVEVTGLNDDTIYKYIAFGVNVDKERYGTPASVTFSTNPDYNVTFKVEAGEVTASTASFTITHDGKERYTYYGFATDDLTTDAAELAQKAYNGLLDNGAVKDPSVLLSGTSKTVTVEGLAFDKEYRYIVFGVDQVAGSALYFGTPGEASVRTLVDYDAITFSVEPVSVRKNTATFKVSYNAVSELTWYAFNTDDLTTAVADLAKAKIAGITASDYQSGNAVETSVEGLQPLTEYRFIAVGVKDGAVYGTPADFKYTSADEDYDAITFSAEVLEAGLNTAKIKVSHDGGADKFQWIAVVSTDLTSAAADVLPKPEDVAEDAIKSGQELEVEIEGLEQKTEYRYIVSGYRVDASGNKYLYGTPADITFKTDSFWKVSPDWTVTFEGKTDDYAGYPYKFTNTVASGSTSGKYFFALYEQEVFDNFDDVEDMLAATIENKVADLKYLVENYPSYYPDLASLLNEETESEWYNLSFNTYYIFAIVLTDEGEATGKYAYVKYTNEPTAEEKAAYAKWLGSWVAGSDVWEISAEKECVSYIVKGFAPGKGYDIRGSFDATTGNLQFYAQDITMYNNNTYGPVIDALEGCTVRSDGGYAPVRGGYLISDVTMSVDGKSASMSTNSLTLNSGSTVTLAGMNIFGHIQEGDYAGYYLTYNAAATPWLLPNTINRPSDTGSAAYNAWLGSWTIDHQGTTDTWVITQDVADVSYMISGIDNTGDRFGAIVKAHFNSSDGTISVSEQESLYSYDNSGETVDVALYGSFSYESKNYYWGGGAQIFTGAIGSDGKATLTGSLISSTYGYFTGFALYGCVGGSATYVFNNNVSYVLPATMTKGANNVSRPAAKVVRSAVTGKGTVRRGPTAGDSRSAERMSLSRSWNMVR